MTVFLVGAGPGDPDLLTLKAARLLEQADVVLYDRLVSPAVLALISPDAALVPVGKDPNGERTTQEQINELLIRWGREVDTVVRLKGGDPFVFGRGGEEALAVGAAGLDCEVVPGISSSIAAPSAAGIPVTHRGLAASVTIITATERRDVEGDGTVWQRRAQLCAEVGGTLVFLMGASRAARIRDALIGAGMSATMACAVITKASTPDQRVERLPLGDLGTAAVANPSVIIVGEVAALGVTSTAHLAALVG